MGISAQVDFIFRRACSAVAGPVRACEAKPSCEAIALPSGSGCMIVVLARGSTVPEWGIRNAISANAPTASEYLS